VGEFFHHVELGNKVADIFDASIGYFTIRRELSHSPDGPPVHVGGHTRRERGTDRPLHPPKGGARDFMSPRERLRGTGGRPHRVPGGPKAVVGEDGGGKVAGNHALGRPRPRNPPLMNLEPRKGSYDAKGTGNARRLRLQRGIVLGSRVLLLGGYRLRRRMEICPDEESRNLFCPSYC